MPTLKTVNAYIEDSVNFASIAPRQTNDQIKHNGKEFYMKKNLTDTFIYVHFLNHNVYCSNSANFLIFYIFRIH